MAHMKIEYFLHLWDLTLEESPLETMTGLIAKVKWREQPCILKVAREGSDEKTAAVLKHYDGNGAVRLIKLEGQATLLERAMPGTHLSALVLRGEDDQATQILCDVIKKLHARETFFGSTISVEDLKEGFERYLYSGDSQIPQSLVKEAESIYGEFVKSQKKPILLHGDLHHDNVLYDERRGWLAIDPKGYIGEPTYEVGALLRNPVAHPDLYQNPERMRRRVSIICERLGFERERVIAWAFSQVVLAGIWSVEDQQSPQWAVETALAFKRHFKEELQL